MITPPNNPRRPTPGGVSIRPTNTMPPAAPVGRNPGINPQAFDPSQWEDGQTGEAPLPRDTPIQQPSRPQVGIQPMEPPVHTREPTNRPLHEQVPPRPAPIPTARAQMEDIGEPEQPPLDDVKKAKYVKTSIKDANFIRVDLPSRHVFYSFPDVFVRPFKMKDLAKIWRAMQEKDFSQLVDALDATVAEGVDIRDFLPQDFNFLMYWHRINSYPNSPYTVEWTSKYGNKNKHTVRDTNLDITTCELTQEEVDAYREYGLTAPTIRDAEVLKMETMTPDQEFLWERAQFVSGDTVEEKLANLDEFPDLSVEEHIHEFRKRLEFGVKESITVIDQFFNASAAPANLRDGAQKIRDFVEANAGERVVQFTEEALLAKAKEYEEEATEIEEKLAAGQPVMPKEEEITLTLDAFRFFPHNQR